ncbi:chemotaxis protein CheW [Vibrio hannami]|uniref:chemotaxis protein CheW n=1 Tax=Vibrio hannami TaxID=2717094 RepID=UPI00240EDC1C|nr:chemotaxis protein CheW [Vibrio hannami]MDG3088754.1 chemotaxis protein CheW [Vibrio hannami]
MDKKDHVLSGEQALDEYFTALLEEELVEDFALAQSSPEQSSSEQLPSEQVAVLEPPHEEVVEVQEPEVALETSGAYEKEQTFVPEAKLQPDFHSSYTELEYNEFEVPALEDVQRLLDKLESTDFAADVSGIMEKNTDDIAKSVTEVEEIQEWDIPVVEQLAEEVIKEATPEVEISEVPQTEIVEEVVEEQEVELETQTGGMDTYDWQSTERSEDFQVLYFEVTGVTFAVPLDELGGIHRIGDMSHLIGRPGWYLGLQTNKEDQLDVVDTAKWVMAERLSDDSHKEGYQYVVMLGLSNWGLASTELKGTETLNADKVNWRTQAGKRPWLAGMVREKMCALIHVEALIKMLNAGLDVKSLDS